MPLVKRSSEASLQKNIEKEIESGKSPKQAAAIAYSIQRKYANDCSELKARLVDVLKRLISSLE